MCESHAGPYSQHAIWTRPVKAGSMEIRMGIWDADESIDFLSIVHHEAFSMLLRHPLIYE